MAENFPVEMEWTFRLGSHQQFRRAAFVIHVLLLVARTPSTKEKSNVACKLRKQTRFVDRLLTSRTIHAPKHAAVATRSRSRRTRTMWPAHARWWDAVLRRTSSTRLDSHSDDGL